MQVIVNIQTFQNVSLVLFLLSPVPSLPPDVHMYEGKKPCIISIACLENRAENFAS